jgi:hypothetical protein
VASLQLSHLMAAHRQQQEPLAKREPLAQPEPLEPLDQPDTLDLQELQV